jgi:hypothetical protein
MTDIPDEVQEISKIDISDGVPDWVHGMASSIVSEEVILDELGIDKSDIPRERAIVLHTEYHHDYPLVVSGENVVRIECRVGEGYETKVGDSYDVSELVNHLNYIVHTNEYNDDTTYTDFYFEPTETLQKVCEIL